MNEVTAIDFRKLFESAPGLYLVLDRNFTIVGVTDSYLRATMTVREKILGKGLFEIFPDNPDDPNATGTGNLRSSLLRVVESRKPDAMAVQKYDIRRPESEGGGFEERYWSPINSPVLGADGGLSYIIHRVEDVTEFVRLKRLENEQSKLNDELKSRAGQMEVDIYRRAQELQEANRQLRMAEEVIKKANDDLERRVADRIEQLKQTEAQMRQLQKMDAIGALAGGIAHDFNNILGAINMYCDLLVDGSGEPSTVREHAQEIRLTIDRGVALTRQLLIFSRKQIFQFQSIDLNELIRALLKMLNRLITENIQIVTKLSPDVSYIRADPAQVDQVIMNLVVNARDAMPKGGVITLETSSVVLTKEFTNTHLSVLPGPHVVLTVSDTGVGMPAAIQARLFEPFFTTKPVGKGTGLGLSTAYGIIKQCKGTIWVYSEVGRGTVFKIYFPSSEKVIAVPEPERADVIRQIVSETVLLVEDDEKLRELYSFALRKIGYQVLVAGNGIEAIAILEQQGLKVHLLLTDVVMPKMGGIELSKIARKSFPKLRTLYMSGYADDPAGGEFDFEDPKFNFIQKPFDTSALLSKIREVLES